MPAGLSFNTATGTITGTPTALSPTTTYTVTASNTGGTSTTTFSLAVATDMLTTHVTGITHNAATTGGTVDASLTGITERGVVWGTITGPTTTSNTGKLPDVSTGTGAFTSSLTGLSPNTTYYLRAYVIHSSGTSYGSEMTFITNQSLSMPDLTKTYGDAAFLLTAPTSNGSGQWTFTSGTPAVATITGNTVTIRGVGTSTITATQAAVAPYAGASTSFVLTVNGIPQSINLNIPNTTPLKNASGLAIVPTSTSGQVVTLTLGAGSVSASLTGTAPSYSLSSVAVSGNLVFEASVPAYGYHAAATLTRSMDVTKNNQSITFPELTPVTYASGLTQTLGASTNAIGLSVSYTVVNGPGSVAGNTLTITGPGEIIIRASQAGDGSYNPASDVQRTLTVNPAAPLVTSFMPTSAARGETVTITGENFHNLTDVSFGGTSAASFTVVNTTTIIAVPGSGATGSVAVTTSAGTHSKTGFRYKVNWTGATSAFSTASNWSNNRTPQTGDDIVFSPTAASDMELVADTEVGDVDFNGSIRSIKLGAYNLTVKGNLSMPGNINGTGRVIMGGTTAQTITGGGTSSGIPDLEINNAGGVSITGDEVNVTGRLRLTAGTLNTNGKLRLSSNSSGTARVGQVTGAITGNVIAERYVQRNNNTGGTGRAWRLVSVPVTGSGMLRDFFMNGRNGQDLTDQTIRIAETENSGTPIVGHNYATASDATTAGYDWIGVANQVSSLRSYVGDPGGGTFLSENVPNLATTFTSADQGYMVFARGDRKLDFPSTNSASATTFRSTGVLKTGDQTVSIAPPTTSKYTLVGNPYMSVLDLSALYQSNSSVINPSFWIWDANIAGSNYQGGYVNVYKSGSQWVTNTGSYLNPERIESGTAFFVEPWELLQSATNITISETHKSSDDAAGLSPMSTDRPDDHGRIYVRLERVDVQGQRQIIDGVMADFHKDFKDDLGDISDREKLRNAISRGALWFARDQKILSGQGLPWPTATRKSVPLYMSAIGDQMLMARIEPRGMENRYVKAWLKDKVLDREVEINMSTPLDYEFIGTGSAALDSTRFELVFTEADRPTTGQTLQPDDAAEQPSVKLYPNPSKSNDVKLSLRAMSPGTYAVQVLDMTGRLVATTALQHRSVNGEYRILEGRLLSPGTYIIKLSDQNKQPKETLRLMVE